MTASFFGNPLCCRLSDLARSVRFYKVFWLACYFYSYHIVLIVKTLRPAKAVLAESLRES